MERIKPILVVFKGQPATGKSTLAEQLSKSLGWQLIIRDQIKEDLIVDGVDEDILGKKSHEIMWNKARDILVNGSHCILDTNLNQKIAYDDLVELEKNIKARILIIDCFCSDESVHKARFDERKKMNLSPFWIKNWDEYQYYLKSEKNNGDFEINYPMLRVDMSQECNFEEIKKWIEMGKDSLGVGIMSGWGFSKNTV